MEENKLFKIGISGAVVTAICCFTPVMVVLLGAIGLSALTGYLDFVLFPSLALFLIIIGIALWKRNRKAKSQP